MTITHKGHPLFLWTNSRLTLGCPAGLSSSLMCSPQPLLPRRPGVPAGQQLRYGAPASSIFPIALRHGASASSFPMALRHGASASSISATAPWPLLPRRPGQQLPDGAPPRRSGQQCLRHGAPASNKPHPAEKSTPVWLAIWRTWAGFANSQLRHAAFRSIYLYRCAHSSCFHLGAAAQTDANLSALCTDCLRHLRISAE